MNLFKIVLLLALLVFFACVANGTQEPESVVANELPATVTFTEHIEPLLKDQCLDCHSSTGTQGLLGSNLAGYDNAQARVDSIISTAVELIYMPPGSRRKLTAYEKALIKKWKTDGTPQ